MKPAIQPIFLLLLSSSVVTFPWFSLMKTLVNGGLSGLLTTLPLQLFIDWELMEEQASELYAHVKPADDATVRKSVQILCYSKENPDTPFEITADDIGPFKDFCSQNCVQKFVMHGFGQNGQCLCPMYIKDAYMENEDCGMVCNVDWGPLAKYTTPSNNLSDTVEFTQLALDYYKATLNTKSVGLYLAEVLQAIAAGTPCDFSHFHLIGFSLGAHVAGWAGNIISQSTNETAKCGRITGLDPAGPLFYLDKVGRSLNKSDANYVDIIHVDKGEFGTTRSLGHSNFGVNGGSALQPGCDGTVQENALENFDFSSNDLLAEFMPIFASKILGCNHLTAPKYYAQSIFSNSSKFTIQKCESDDSLKMKAGIGCSNASSVKFGYKCSADTVGFFNVKAIPTSPTRTYQCE